MNRDSGTRRHWVRLDNASNIFLAARTESDPKVFRISAEVDHDVEPEMLQRALDETFDRYPLFHAVLRRGIFWYYLQDSDLRPVVAEESLPTCAAIYQGDHRALLFRVVYYRRRISLETFHALSDGTGALWFLSDLVTAYLRMRYHEPLAGDERVASLTEEDGQTELTRGLVADSFGHHFRRERRHDLPAPETDFGRAAAPATEVSLTDDAQDHAQDHAQDVARSARKRRGSTSTVFRVRGTRSPDNRTRAVELTMPASDVLDLARAEGVSPTMYLTAMFLESIRQASNGLGEARTLSASVPVNLRQFFPSTSARNFFATVRVEHTYGDEPEELGAIARQLEKQFRPKASPEALEAKLRRLIRLERLAVLRILPRPFKDLILRVVNWGNNRGLTVAVSNLGRVSLPRRVDSHVGRMLFHVSAVRPQFCAMTHAGILAIVFSSPFTETGHVKEFARLLSDRGIDVNVAAAAVTELELAEVSP
ncbi:hypothetical protein [Gulosibacter molinativorax]|uniref:Alcohol acetyltransferase n=1 Tax=Gulosibacter molinativorax TaxID=256821 RepID=A0ABT7C6M1_9MICO|nr:hypothetical protein [Gulosibacter molinativorax]MDJ1370321.1 alcohol acetyltransferase [Gulosibacter molinativorax]